MELNRVTYPRKSYGRGPVGRPSSSAGEVENENEKEKFRGSKFPPPVREGCLAPAYTSSTA